MPGVRPSETWRDWNQQSFRQSRREVRGGVVGGDFISKIHSQSHPAGGCTWFGATSGGPDGPPNVNNGGSGAPSSASGVIARSTWNARSRKALTPASTSRSYRVYCERIPEAMHCTPAPAHRSRCRTDDLAATFAED